MAAKLTSTQVGASADYYRYIYNNPVVKTDSISDVDTLDFTVVASDTSFVGLKRGAYIVASSDLYPNWFTGYIGNDPEMVYVGTDPTTKTNLYSLTYQAQSDEILLSQQALGLVDPFLNKTQGQILAALANTLLPGVYDSSGIQDGQFIARYVVDPTKKYSDIVKEFTESSVYRFSSRNHTLYFAPLDVSETRAPNVTVDATSRHFTPSNLQIRASKNGVTNEAVVLGGIEPQNLFTEYFVGDAATAQFPLLASVYGAESAVFLDETFSGTTVDTSKWTVYDSPSAYLQISNGYLNVLGGDGSGAFDVHLDSAQLLPLSGTLRFDHGDIDFVDSPSVLQGNLGVIGGTWTQAPNSSFSGCVYGLLVVKDSDGLKLKPVCNGALTGDSFTVNTLKRYVIKTNLATSRARRSLNSYHALDSSGVIQTFAGEIDTAVPEAMSFTTWISEIDPTTGTLDVGFPVALTASMSPTSTTAAYGLYIPVASNNLHMTVTNITVSSPISCSLETQVTGSSAWQSQIVGPNEVDALDGLAPVATVSQSGGESRKSSVLGTPRYAVANPLLQFFKNSTAQTSTIPNAGTKLRLRYREAGTAVGRSRDVVSVAAESASWGDSGVRSVTQNSATPLPTTSAECEAAAAAIVMESSVTRYEGTYTIPSLALSGEPLAGGVIRFTNMPTNTFISSTFGELIYSVKTTLLSTGPGTEVYSHEISFGKSTDHLLVQQLLAGIGKQADVFTPTDSVEMPAYVEPRVIGNAYGPDALNVNIVSMDAAHIQLSLEQDIPPGCLLEARSTDSGWGCESGSNLIARTASNAFTLPRNSRTKAAFVKLVKPTNFCPHSEDFSVIAVGGGHDETWVSQNGPNTIHQELVVGPDGPCKTAHVPRNSSLVMGVNHATQPGWYTVSCFVKGVPGTTVTTRVVNYPPGGGDPETHLVYSVLSGGWRRLESTVKLNSAGVYFAVGLYVGDSDCLITKVQFEQSDAASGYVKTSASPYGPASRYATGVRVNYPFVPEAPGATLTFLDESDPVISLTLPVVGMDVWGYEIRAADNVTVLERQALADSGIAPNIRMPQVNYREIKYYCYTYNLLGEYSSPTAVSHSMPTPAVTLLEIDNATKTVVWDSTDAKGFILQIDTVDDTFTHLAVNQVVSNNFYQLSDADFFGERWFKIIPYDDLGQGSPSTAAHSYIPVALDELAGNEVTVITTPTGGAVAIPSNFQKYSTEYTQLAYSTYRQNTY